MNIVNNAKFKWAILKNSETRLFFITQLSTATIANFERPHSTPNLFCVMRYAYLRVLHYSGQRLARNTSMHPR